MRHRVTLPELMHSVSVVRKRFAQDRLAATAASLSFTSLISMVPLLAVAFALFTAFPAFQKVEIHLQQRFAHALLPPEIASTVFRYLNAFAAKAKELGAVGVAGLAVLATSMMLTVDGALNAIWRTPRPRPLAQRVLLYWAGVTLGPLAMAGTMASSVALMAAHRGWTRAIPGGIGLVLTLLAWVLLGVALTGLYRFVPNTDVRWRDAAAGAAVAVLGLFAAGRALAWYLAVVPTYTAVYGTFAALPIFLLWIDWSWVVVLLGAVFAASLPALRLGARPQPDHPGSRLLLALRVLRLLDRARAAPDPGLDLAHLTTALRCDPLELQPVLGLLESLGWAGRVMAPSGVRWALLVDPARTPAGALLDAALLDPRAAARAGAPALVDETHRSAPLADLLQE